MRLRTILVTSIATAAVVLISPKPTPFLDMPSIAKADTNVSVSIGTFYDDLAPHGSWVDYQDSYVFVPRHTTAGWRPYTVGHWAHTERYGWLWVSDEPFGWATYHYGRWGYAEDIGWYWVPGKRWAPAWVSWRRSNDHVVWAPLPPGRGDDVSVEIQVSDIPDNYWVAVPSRDFLDDDLSVVVIHDDTERVRFVEAAEPVGNVTIENNIVVNNVIDVDYVEKTTEKKVETVKVKETQDPKQAGKGSDGEVAIFSGEVKEEKDAKPAQLKDVEEVKKQKAETGETPQGQQPTTEGQGTTQEQPAKKKATGTEEPEQQEAQPEEGQQPEKKKQQKAKGTEEPAQQQEAQPEEGQQPEKKKQQKAKGTEEPAQQQEAQPEEGQQPVKKKQKKAKGTEEPAQQQEAQPEEGQEQPVKKQQKKAKGTEEPAQQQEAQPEEGQGQPVKRKKSKASEQSTEPEGAQSEQGHGEPPVKKKQKAAPEEPAQSEQPPAQGCDPASGQGC